MTKPAKDPTIFYRRNLPHWQPPNATIFLTWRLHGSLPKEVLARLKTFEMQIRSQSTSVDEDLQDRTMRQHKQIFARYDRMLHEDAIGPQWLADDRLAALVVDSLFFHSDKLYNLLAYVVMSNHVHVLLHPLKVEESDQNQAVEDAEPQYVLLRNITKSLKGYTAWKANQILARTGQTFWQTESFDHWVRNQAEMERIIDYIESDPVRSELVAKPEDWRWSSAWERESGRWQK